MQKLSYSTGKTTKIYPNYPHLKYHPWTEYEPKVTSIKNWHSSVNIFLVLKCIKLLILDLGSGQVDLYELSNKIVLTKQNVHPCFWVKVLPPPMVVYLALYGICNSSMEYIKSNS